MTSAVLIGSGIGLALGAAYLAGGMGRAATDHARASRLAEAAAGGFSESVLQNEAAAMDPGVLRVARAHDPFTVAGSAERDRQAAILAARLDRKAPDERPLQSAGLMRAAFTSTQAAAAAPFHLAGALETSRELDCLTQAVYFEARGETSAGQAAVAQVVLNRVRNPAFPKSVCAVVFQGAARRTGCQFSFACDGSMRRGREMIAWNRAQHVAARALSGAVMSAVGNATHFHTVNVQPGWSPSLLRVAQVGLHVFYRFGHGAPANSADDGGPEMTAHPVFASVAAPSLVAASSPTELRLASALVTESPADAPAGLRGAVDAPAEAKPAEALKASAAKLTPASQPRNEPAKDSAATAS
ncbi:MAG TPA: cell wall hydrolase [Phenylobacterium sp.]|nr:cell wall hydrolase [Phenylobacterium sp.]